MVATEVRSSIFTSGPEGLVSHAILLANNTSLPVSPERAGIIRSAADALSAYMRYGISQKFSAEISIHNLRTIIRQFDEEIISLKPSYPSIRNSKFGDILAEREYWSGAQTIFRRSVKSLL